MKRPAQLIFTGIYLLISSSLTARDINLDEIYIKKTSKYLKKLTRNKLKTYQDIKALFIDNDVIFSEWVSGNEIYYIKENSRANTNIIYKYRLKKKKRYELCKIKGVITIARISINGRYLVLKRLIQNNGIIPSGELIILNIRTRELTIQKSRSPFLDFSIPGEGNSIIYEVEKGLIEFFPDLEIKQLLLKKSQYIDIASLTSPSIAYTSPDRQKILVINGSGGNYKAKVINRGNSIKLNGITSSSEVFWIDNSHIALRTGSPGNFSVGLYNIKKKKMLTLMKKSYNTNIYYSIHPKILSFLKDGIVQLYYVSDNRPINTGIEGEDISCAPSGARFTSLLCKKLFIINVNNLKKRQVELKRSWENFLSIYGEIKNKRDELENEYSIQYVNRKISVYRKLTGK